MLTNNSEKNDVVASQFITSMEKNIDTSFRTAVVLPGDDVTTQVTGLTQSIRIGNGLAQQGDRVISTATGLLSYRAPANYWSEPCRKRYYPKAGDKVVGIIEERGGEFYTVNIFSGAHCILNRLGFEGATKRNRPELKKGDIIYAKVIRQAPDVDTELCCKNPTGSKKEWSTGETVYGELPQGLILQLPLDQTRALLQPDCAVLNALGRHFVYEVAVGMNGVIWMRTSGKYISNSNIKEPGGVTPSSLVSKSLMNSIVIRNAVLNAPFMDGAAEVDAMVDRLVSLSIKAERARAQRD